jgi:RNA-directed DNA polymerase
MSENKKRIEKGDGKSERLRSTGEAGEPGQGTPSREGGRGDGEPREGQETGPTSPSIFSTGLAWVAEQARRHPERVFTTLAHHIDVEHLRRAHELTRKDGATGVDGVTAAEYEAKLDENLASLLARFKSGTYYAPPVRRVKIPKADGKTRLIGIPTFEDKVLQRAVAMVLEAVYEQDFFDVSYGFRPGRSAHHALQSVWRAAMKSGGGVVLDVDIRGFFDSLEHHHLRAILDLRIRDGVIRRTIDKWLKAGALDGSTLVHPERGTPQGGVISPILANIYLHHVLDRWFETEVKPRLRGNTTLVRYADDFVILCSDEHDAARIMAVLPKRFGKFGLELHPEKTKLVSFRPPMARDDDDNHTFDFLGFTHVWSRTKNGGFAVKRRTAKDRLRRAIRALHRCCRSMRHAPLKEQCESLGRRLRGHYGYYGLRGNYPSLRRVYTAVLLSWRQWLSHRSQNGYFSWNALKRLLARYPLPRPRITHS